nr:reverse transcriptase domain-containing protein [Desulfosporosinus sp. Sb-LF]
MQVDELLPFLKEHKNELVQSLWDGKYRPKPVRRVEMPKENGKTRKLGIPTVVGRLIQQAITQVLSPIFEKQFSDNSYGFRPKRSAHDALWKCQNHITEGYKYVVDMDLVQCSKMEGYVTRTDNSLSHCKFSLIFSQWNFLQKYLVGWN